MSGPDQNDWERLAWLQEHREDLIIRGESS